MLLLLLHPRGSSLLHFLVTHIYTHRKRERDVWMEKDICRQIDGRANDVRTVVRLTHPAAAPCSSAMSDSMYVLRDILCLNMRTCVYIGTYVGE